MLHSNCNATLEARVFRPAFGKSGHGYLTPLSALLIAVHFRPQLQPPIANMRRPKVKTATLTVRLDPKIKAAAEAAAEHDHRSLTSLLEVLIVNHCRALGLSPEHFAKEPRQ